ncbi:MAG: VanZ family protein [Coriobacteriia bacterium]|nr:VanZ family protein [Coriobacteriia bacterium]
MTLISLFVQDMMRYVLAALPMYLLARFTYLKLRRHRTSAVREVLLGLCVLYAVALVSQTVLPPGHYGFENGGFYAQPIIRPDKHLNLVPLRTVGDYVIGTNDEVSDWGQVSSMNLLGNVLLFAPLGFLVPLMRARHTGLRHVLALGLVVSITIESAQYFLGRSADIDDVLLNAVGVMIGYAALALAGVPRPRTQPAPQLSGGEAASP